MKVYIEQCILQHISRKSLGIKGVFTVSCIVESIEKDTSQARRCILKMGVASRPIPGQWESCPSR